MSTHPPDPEQESAASRVPASDTPAPTRRSRRAARQAADADHNADAGNQAPGEPIAPPVSAASVPEAGTLAGLVADPQAGQPTPAPAPEPDADPFNWSDFLGGASGRTDNQTQVIHPPADPHPGSAHHRAGHHPHLGSHPQVHGGFDEQETTPGVGTRFSRRAQLATEPPREKKKRTGAWGCLIVLVVFLALGGVAAFVLQGPISQLIAATQPAADYTGTGAEDVIVVIHSGDSGHDITETLVAADVVASYDAFYDLLLKQLPAPVFQPGAYQMKTQMSAAVALDALTDPANKLENTVLVQEGLAEADVLISLSETLDVPLADVQGAAADVASYGLPAEATTLEGFLFPATYTFDPGTTPHDALQTMVTRQFQALDEAGVAVQDRWKTIVLASLIQREAGLKDDFYKVSRVFQNRLDPAQWPSGLLQSDATVAYGTGNTHLVTTTDAERADANNAYNTYVHPGLPIGPISNPGDLAIDAALHPAEGSWLFFVTWNLDTGETIFSTTVEEHDAAVAKWLAWMDEHPEYG